MAATHRGNQPTVASPQTSAKELERIAVNINPGGWSVDDSRPVSTLLGSCVAVCLHDPAMRVGGMNHFLLPSRSDKPGADTDVVLAGDYSMEILVNSLLGRGARKERLVAKAFGGGTIVSSIRMAIGERNAEFAKEWLAREGIPLVASDFLGPWSRKVLFVPRSGEAYCKRIPITQVVAQVAQAEQAYEKTLTAPKPEKKIELF